MYYIHQQGLLDFYQDSTIGPMVYFYMIFEAENIGIPIPIPCEANVWKIQMVSHQQVSITFHTCHNACSICMLHVQVSRAAVEGYTGEGEPPCIVMTLKSDESTPPDLSLPVVLTGVREPNNTILIERAVEGAVCSYLSLHN